MRTGQLMRLNKVGTHSFALPKVNKTKARYDSYQHSGFSENKISFTERVHPLTKQVQYDQMNTSNIGDEHKRLKFLLRQFNSETYQILGKYIDKPLDQIPKRPRPSSKAVVETKGKELENGGAVLEMCQKELQKLQEKCNHLKYITVEDFQRKIIELKHSIHEITCANKEINRSNKLRGLEINKDSNKEYNDVPDLEYEKCFLDLKKERLQNESSYVAEQTKKISEKMIKADESMKKITEAYQKALKDLGTQKNQQELKKQLQKKKQHLNKLKQYTNKRKYVYLMSLKELQQKVAKIKSIDDDIYAHIEKNEQSKKQLAEYEKKYKQLRKSKQFSIEKKQEDE